MNTFEAMSPINRDTMQAARACATLLYESVVAPLGADLGSIGGLVTTSFADVLARHADDPLTHAFAHAMQAQEGRP